MDSNKTSRFSWFWKWFLNNKVVTALLISLLVLLNILLFSKLSYLFEPIWQFINAVALPVILASILFYILNPMVDWLEKKKIPRIVSIVLLFILILALLTIGILILIPKIQSQVESFIVNWPSYWEVIEKSTNDLMSNQYLGQFKPEIEDLNNTIYNTIGDFIKNISKTTFSGIGNFVGAVANIVVAVITMPFVLFFLLKDGGKLLPSFINLLPIRIRNATSRILIDVNNQVSQYIRGQLIVAFAVAVMFIVGFSIIGLNYGFTLGIMAGFLNLIPYLGSFLAMVPAVLLGAVAGPVMLIKVILVFIIEQTIEGRFVSPLVLSNKLDIHPLTIIFVLLASGKMFGVAGVILGIPGYAVIKVLATHLFMWYQQVSGLYDSTKPILPTPLKQEKES